MPVRPNDRCPCGSGKKYKKCCGRTVTADGVTGLPGASLSDDECREIANALLPRILNASHLILSKGEGRDAVRKFMGLAREDEAVLKDDEMTQLAFTDFLIHDWRPARGGTLLKRFKDMHGHALSDAERAQIDRWLTDRRRGWFEVEKTTVPATTELKDCMTGETHAIYDKSLAAQARKGDMYLASVFPCGGRWEMGGMVTQVPRHIRLPFRAWLEEAFGAWRRDRPEPATWAAFFSDRAPEIEREMQRIAKTPPRVITTTGERVAYGYRLFTFDSREAVFWKLRGLSALRLRGRTKGNRVAGDGFDWRHDLSEGPLPFGQEIAEGDVRSGGVMIYNTRTVEPGRDSLRLEPDGEHVLALLILDARRLEIQAFSKERLQYVSEAVLASLGDLVKECESERIDPEYVDQLWERHLKGELEAPKPGKPDLSPEEAAYAERIMGEYMKKHWEGWLDIPLPALGGKTPREASRDREARIELEALLRDMEDSDRRGRGGDGQPDPHLLRARKELGLD